MIAPLRPAEVDRAPILVVDDHQANLLLIEDILRAEGRDILTASSGREALRMLMQHDFSVILLDVNMPGMDGFEVAKMIRERPRSHQTPIIFVTAIRMEDASVEQGYALGAVDYIFTPIAAPVLRAKVSFFVDLFTKTRRLQALLREREASEARFRCLFHDSPVPLWELDLSKVKARVDALRRSGISDLHAHFLRSREELTAIADELELVEVNRATLDMCEAETEDRLRAALRHVFGEHVDVLREPIATLDKDVVVSEAEGVLHTLRGGRKHVSFRVSVQPGHEQTWSRVVVCSTDIAELQRQRRELERSNRELQQFAYVASHDLRAPLRAIDSLSAWLEKDLDAVLDAEQREHMGLLRGRVQRMNRLLSDLLEYARAGGESVDVEVVNTDELVAEVVELCSVPSTFFVDYVGPGVTFRTARLPLRRVLLNLIGNAIKHHDQPSGRVSIRIADGDDYLEFRIADDGPGIPPRFHEKVFQMFQTLRPRDAVEGSGMGLALVRKLVDTAGGLVALESSGGRGAAFTFTWPREWSARARPTPRLAAGG